MSSSPSLTIDRVATVPSAPIDHDRYDDDRWTPDPVARLVRPVAGVSLELYARIVKSIEIVNHDLSLLAPMAAAHGVGHDDWVAARRGWNERIASEDAIRELFAVLYRSTTA